MERLKTLRTPGDTTYSTAKQQATTMQRRKMRNKSALLNYNMHGAAAALVWVSAFFLLSFLFCLCVSCKMELCGWRKSFSCCWWCWWCFGTVLRFTICATAREYTKRYIDRGRDRYIPRARDRERKRKCVCALDRLVCLVVHQQRHHTDDTTTTHSISSRTAGIDIDSWYSLMYTTQTHKQKFVWCAGVAGAVVYVYFVVVVIGRFQRCHRLHIFHIVWLFGKVVPSRTFVIDKNRYANFPWNKKKKEISEET